MPAGLWGESVRASWEVRTAIVKRLMSCLSQCITMEHPLIQFREGLALDAQPSLNGSLPEFSADPLPSELQQLQTLFQAAAFWAENRRVEDLAVAIANSKPVFSVWDQNRLIGFARATSDGVYRATIWDVVIHPTYRGAGLGRRLVEMLLTHPHINGVERVYLMTTHQQPFYESIGFQSNSSTTMVLQPQQRHSTAVESLAARASH